MIVEAELDPLPLERAHELPRVRNERAPVIATLPAVVVPGEIEHQGVERNPLPAHALHFTHEVPLVVALELRLLRLWCARKVLEVEIGDPRAEHEARNHGNGSTELGVLR